MAPAMRRCIKSAEQKEMSQGTDQLEELCETLRILLAAVPAESGKQQHESRTPFPILLKSIEQYFMVFLTFGRLGTSVKFSDT